MIAIDTAAAAMPGVTGSVNAALNGVLGLYVIIQTVARFVPTLKHSEINHWFGKVMNYVFLYSKTYTKSNTGVDNLPVTDVPGAEDTAELGATEVAEESSVSTQVVLDQGSNPTEAAARAVTAAAAAVVSVAGVVQRKADKQ